MSERLPGQAATPLPATATGAARRRGAFDLGIVVLAALVLGAVAAPGGAAEYTVTQLSEGHAFSEIYFASTPPQISPDNQYAVYVQDAVANGAHELWSVALAGGDPVRLSDTLNSGQSVKFAISPDSNYVVYLVDQDFAGVPELYSVPIAGGARTKLNMDLHLLPGQVRDFLISPTSQRVYYAADGEVNNVIELWRVDIDGGASTRLNAEITSSYDIFEYAVGITTGGSERVVYRVGRTVQGEHELWSVPGTGSSATAGKISRSMGTGGGVDPYFRISPNGTRVVYSADAVDNGSFNLYSVAITGGTSTQLNGDLGGANGVEPDFVISADSLKVAYRSDEGTDNVLELYGVPITGGGATKLNTVLPSGGDVLKGAIAPDSVSVVYRADQVSDGVNELFSVPITGGTPIKLNPTPVASGDVLDFAISPAVGGRVVYLADQNTNDLNELFSVPLTGGATTRLNSQLASNGDVQAFQVSPSGDFVVYGADQFVDAKDELLRVPIAGGSVETVNDPLGFNGDVALTFLGVSVFAISADNLTIVYSADPVTDGEIELFKSVSFVGGPPDPPTGVVAVAGNGQVTVTFVPPSNNGGSPITGYAVTPSPATVGWVDNNAGSTSLTHLVTNLTNGTAYTFTVRATNANGTGDPSSPSNVATPATIPSAPTAVGAVPRNFGADVTFAAPASNGGSAITGYTVISNPAGGVDLHQGTTALKHYVLGLTNGIPYTFTVVAQNGVGPSNPSAPSTAVTPGCIPDVGNIFCDGVESSDTSAWSFTLGPPGAPTTVVAVGGNASATVTFVAPLSDGGSPITGYTATSIPAGGVDSNAGSTGLSHVVTGLANGVSYTFTVRATNAGGAGPASAESNPVTPATVPGAPASVVAVAGDSSATVVFVAPIDDGGSVILGYTVIADPPGGIDGDAGTTALSHAISGLTNGTEYTFTVTAANAVGSGSPSKPSNPVTPNP